MTTGTLRKHDIPNPFYDEETIARCAEQLFAQEDGRAVLAYLRAITIDRTLAPACDDATLRHVEGQRYIVARLIRWSEGRRQGVLYGERQGAENNHGDE